MLNYLNYQLSKQIFVIFAQSVYSKTRNRKRHLNTKICSSPKNKLFGKLRFHPLIQMQESESPQRPELSISHCSKLSYHTIPCISDGFYCQFDTLTLPPTGQCQEKMSHTTLRHLSS